MRALIDMDLLCYELGSSVDPDGYPLDWPLVRWRVDERINLILNKVEATSWSGYLTSQDRSNFRYKLATIREYKQQRQKRDKPYWYQQIYDYLCKVRGAYIVEGMEADDAISIEQWKNLNSIMKKGSGRSRIKERADTVICSRDKDLLIVPGWHYGWETFNTKEHPPFWVDPIEGLRNFYKQCINGDTADNIPGLYTIGPKSLIYRRLDNLNTELDMFAHVYKQYQKWYGNYAKQFLLEVGNLLWMKRTEDDVWQFPKDWETATASEPDASGEDDV